MYLEEIQQSIWIELSTPLKMQNSGPYSASLKQLKNPEATRYNTFVYLGEQDGSAIKSACW